MVPCHFTRDRIHIDQLTARTGGGTLEVKGDATNYKGQLNFNLRRSAKKCAFAIRPGSVQRLRRSCAG